MLSTSIGPKLENNGNEMEEPKVDNVEEDQNYDLLKKNNNEKDDTSITSNKMTQLTKGINQGKM